MWPMPAIVGHVSHFFSITTMHTLNAPGIDITENYFNTTNVMLPTDPSHTVMICRFATTAGGLMIQDRSLMMGHEEFRLSCFPEYV